MYHCHLDVHPPTADRAEATWMWHQDGGVQNRLRGATPVLARAGDVVLFDRRLWHMRSENRGGVTRKALLYAYAYRWVRPRDDVAVRPEPFGAITPVRAQLLGAGSSAIGHWVPELDDPPLRAWWEAPASPSGATRTRPGVA
jgi:ectoine hydroxylase-related dioxygenase (phytanoyl-CoA dioxygenase family)